MEACENVKSNGMAIVGIVGVLLALSTVAAVHSTEPSSMRCEQVGSVPAAECHDWSSRYVGSGDWNDRPAEVFASPDGSLVHVVGDSVGDDSARDIVAVTYDAETGEEVWRYRYDAADGGDLPEDAALSSDGDLYVTGYSADGEGSEDYVVIALDGSTGDQLWATRYDGPATEPTSRYHDLPEALALSPDGEQVLVTGTLRVAEGDYDIGTVSLDASDGTIAWSDRIESPGQAGGQALAVAPDGETVYMAGDQGNGQLLAAYDADTGTPTWKRAVNAELEASVDELILDEQGSGLILVGERDEGSAGQHLLVSGHDIADGTTRWKHEGPPAKANDAELGPQAETLYVGGTTTSREHGAVFVDAAVFAYDASSGEPLWSTTYVDRYEIGVVSDIEVTPSGDRVYAAMSSASTPLQDVDGVTFGLNATTGQTEWAARYAGTNVNANSGMPDASPAGLSLGPDGEAVYTSLLSDDLRGAWDMLTLRYEPS